MARQAKDAALALVAEARDRGRPSAEELKAMEQVTALSPYVYPECP